MPACRTTFPGCSVINHDVDGLGSVVAISNAAGAVVNRYRYETFGMVEATDPEFANSYTYTGREWDREIGLYYYRARYYDPMDGRFLSKDPIGFAGGDVNLYGFVGNGPVLYNDPFGLWQAEGLRDALLSSGKIVRDYFVPRGEALRGQLDAYVSVDIEGTKASLAQVLNVYCNGGSQVVSVCADLGTMVSVVTAQPEIYGISNLVAGANLAISSSVCEGGLTPSKVTTLVGLLAPPVGAFIVADVDILLTAKEFSDEKK